MIFVFGSNLAGRHGKGAALTAIRYWGAKKGEGIGRWGQSYAIPTKDEKIKSLPLDMIGYRINQFLDYAHDHEDEIFMFTPVGTGLAGYTVEEIRSTFNIEKVPSNVLFTASWFK
jgi:hypothetical protein